MITEKSRLISAMNLKKVDRPPCICPGGMMNMVTREVMENSKIFWPDAHLDPTLMAELTKAVHESNCFENYGVPFCMTVEVEAMGAEVDMGSIHYEPHVISYAIDSVSQWQKLKKPDCNKGRTKVVLDAIKILKGYGGNVPIIANLTGPVSIASSLIEPSVYYKELRKNKEQAHALMEFICEHLIEFGIKQMEAGADIIAISDPSGTGEILGPKFFDEFVVQYINKAIKGIKEKAEEAEFIVHICGQMKKVYANLSALNCNTISLDAIVNLKEAKNNLPEKAIMGNVSTYAIESGTAPKVADITRYCMRSNSSIISPACGLGNNSPLANLQAMLKTVKEEGINA